jgi:hypothetical protein
MYPTEYNLIVPKMGKKVFPFPETLNEFISDMKRYNVQLFWDDIIDLMFEPKDYLNKNEISAYFANLLAQLDKSNELLL